MEDRLDWLLEEDDDWREPWQQERPSREGSGPRRESRQRPWQEPARPASRFSDPELIDAPEASGSEVPVARRSGPEPPRSRRPLEAQSRRQPQGPAPAEEDWPQAEDFQVSRWQRPLHDQRRADPQAPGRRLDAAVDRETAAEAGGSRPLPRSTRRRD